MTAIRATKIALAASLGLLLGACATTPIYAPQVTDNGSGYAEQRLDENQYRVTFTGRRSTSRQRVEDGLLLRAAEVTRQSGYSHFIVDERTTERERRGGFSHFSGPRFGFYHGFGWGPRSRWGWYDPFWSGIDVMYDEDRNSRYVAYADIAMLRADEARGNAKAIDAAEVIANLAGKVDPQPVR